MTNITSATNAQTIARLLQNSVMTAGAAAPLSARVVSTGQNNMVPMRPISAYSDAELNSLEHNYRKSARTSGGTYTLRDVMNEKARRITGGLDGTRLVSLILELRIHGFLDLVEDLNSVLEQEYLALVMRIGFILDNKDIGNISQLALTLTGNVLIGFNTTVP